MAYQISTRAATIGILRTTNIQMKVETSMSTIVPGGRDSEQVQRRHLRPSRPPAQAGAVSRAVMERRLSKRSSISSRVSRPTRSVPNSSTLNEAITVP